MFNKQSIFVFILVLVLVSGYFISAHFDNHKNLASDYDSVSSRLITSFAMPGNLQFGGESVPVNDIDLVERYDREIMVNAYYHSNTILLLKRTGRWFPVMKPILEKYNIPLDFLYLPVIESGLTNSISPRGAVGFWQLTEVSAKELGLMVNEEVDERYNPVRSTEAACIFLLKSKQKFGSWTNAAAAYNMGMRGLARSMELQKMDSYYNLLLNEETSRYIFRILSTKEIFTNPLKYGFSISADQYYKPEKVKELEINETLPDLADFALAKGINYKLLKRYNPWLRTNHLTVKNKSGPWIINIPVEHADYNKESTPVEDSLMIGEDRYNTVE
jgi:membrane-bound lytic murein transglycosylase D